MLMSTANTHKSKLLLFRADEAFAKKLTEWRRKKTPIPSISEALRQLVEAGWASEKTRLVKQISRHDRKLKKLMGREAA